MANYIVGVTESVETDGGVERAVELFLGNFRNRDVLHVEVMDIETDEVVVVDAKFLNEKIDGTEVSGN